MVKIRQLGITTIFSCTIIYYALFHAKSSKINSEIKQELIIPNGVPTDSQQTSPFFDEKTTKIDTFKETFAKRKQHLEETCKRKGFSNQSFSQDLEHNENTTLIFYNMSNFNTLLCL